MAEIFQMIESEARGLAVIQRNIGDAGKMLVARNGNDGHGNAGLAESVNQDQAFRFITNETVATDRPKWSASSRRLTFCSEGSCGAALLLDLKRAIGVMAA